MKNETAIVEIILKGQAANATLKDLERAAAALRAQIKRLPTDSQEFADKTKEFQNINSRLKSVQNEIKGTGGAFSALSKEVKQFGVLAAGYLGFQWLSSSIKNIISGNAELSDSFADIRKTTGMTDSEVKKLNTSLSQMDTRTSTKELRNIAIGAGQLGIAKGDVLNFTAAVDKMVVSLGDEFTGGASEVTKVMGGLRNIFTDIKTDKVDQDLLHIGNAINVLASSGAATGPVVSDFANRIGGVGINLGLTTGQVLGMSATLQELGVSTERGGTATVKILQKMTTNIDDFAKVAGMKSKEFAALVNKDIYGALIKVVEGSKKSGDSATALGQILDKLGVDGSGASEVISKLGSNTAMLKDKVALANSSLQNTNSIMEEFKLKNSTLGAETDRLGKALAGAFTNSAVSEGLKGIVGWLADLVSNTKTASQSMEEERTHVNALVEELKTSNTTNERRLEIYDELKAINPDIVAGIDRENMSIERLTQNVSRYNQAQIAKIAVQKKQEDIDKAQEKAAEKLTELSERQSQAYEALGKIQQLNGAVGQKAKEILDDENKTLSEKLNLLHHLAVAEQWNKDGNGKITNRNKEAETMAYLLRNVGKLNLSEAEYTELSKKSAELIDEKAQLMKQLGIESEGAGNKIQDMTKKTTKELNEMLNTQKLSGGVAFSAETIKAVYAELERRAHQSETKRGLFDDETNKKILAARKKLLDDIAALEKKNSERYLSDREREEKAVMDKYYGMLNNSKLTAKQEMVVRTAMVNELDDIDKKYHDKSLKEKEKYHKDRERLQSSAEVNEIRDAMEMYDQMIALAKQYGEDATTLETDKWIKIAEIKEKYKKQELKSLEQKKDKKDPVQLGLNQALSFYNDYYSTLNDLAKSYHDQEQIRINAQLKSLDKNLTSETAREKRAFDMKLITEQEYNRRVDKLQSEKAKKEKQIRTEAARKEKQASIFSAILSGLESVAKTVAKYGFTPEGLVLAGLAAASSFARVQVIQSTPVPEFAKGGFTDPAGYVNKPTMFSSSTGAPFIAGEAGAEWIAPNWMLKDPVASNQIKMLEAIRQGRTFAAGGYNTANTNTTSSTAVGNHSVDALAAVVLELNKTLAAGIEAKMYYDDFKKTMNGIDNAAKLSAI